MASENRRRYSRSQSTSEVEAPSSIFVATPAPLSKGPTLASFSETGLSEVGPSEVAGPSEVGPSECITIFLK